MDEKDEIVIQAGARKKTSKTDKTAEVKVEQPAKKVAEEFVREEAHTPQDVREENVAYDVIENNLDDVPSMSLMQKVIIALAALGIFAFVAYYLLVLR